MSGRRFGFAFGVGAVLASVIVVPLLWATTGIPPVFNIAWMLVGLALLVLCRPSTWQRGVS